MKCKICDSNDAMFLKQLFHKPHSIQYLYSCPRCKVVFVHPYTSSRKSSYGEDYYFYKSTEEYSYLNALKQVDFYICPFVDLDKKDQLFFEIGCGMGYVQDILKHKYKNLDLLRYGDI